MKPVACSWRKWTQMITPRVYAGSPEPCNVGVGHGAIARGCSTLAYFSYKLQYLIATCILVLTAFCDTLKSSFISFIKTIYILKLMLDIWTNHMDQSDEEIEWPRCPIIAWHLSMASWCLVSKLEKERAFSWWLKFKLLNHLKVKHFKIL